MKFLRNFHHSLGEAAIASDTRPYINRKPLLDLPSMEVVCPQLTSWAWNGYKEEDTNKDNKKVVREWVPVWLVAQYILAWTRLPLNECGTYLTCLRVYLKWVHFLDNNSFVICRPFSRVSIIFFSKIYIQTETLIMKP